MIKSKSTMKKKIIFGLLVAIIVGLGGYLLLHDKDIAVLQPQGVIAEQQRDLLIFTLLLGLLVVVPVFVMLFVFAWKYRAQNPKKQKYTPEVEGNHIIEAVWWGIPIIIIGVLSVVTWFSTHQLDPYRAIESDKPPLKVQVVSLQWRWLFLYPEQQAATINELRLPVGRPVEFEITGDSPMSAFWVPALGSQTYAMNGMVSKLSLQASKPGVYHGSNTNISGEGYAGMRFKAIASSETEFAAWAQQAAASNDHLTWQRYEELAQPSKDATPRYFMLHDAELFNKIVAKYMTHGKQKTPTSGTIESDNHEGHN